MALYRLAFTTAATAAGAPLVDLLAVASDRAMVKEIGFFLNAATASNIGLCRSANTPVQTGGVLGVAEDSADPAATAKVATAWGTPPTAGTYMSKVALPATIGAGIVLTFPYGRGLVVAAANSLALFNFGAAACSVLNGYVVWEE